MSSFLVLSEGDTRNRWRDGQVCPDVGQGTMAPWARRLGWEDGREREEKEKRKKERREETEKEREEDEKTEEKESERERGARLVWRKGLSPEIGVKKTMNAGGVENRID
ncbi:hypothetical protein TNCV_2485291 [Trichonephila clavipes]|uniref:Uncharacterized protein n=1 Tax=Trichonephila clavipes TaxID=2585209 RepID=A0A8X6VZR9_TRICX|nr:hypothetical protein TNCV_2485291 [Trichonephila clavipes]